MGLFSSSKTSAVPAHMREKPHLSVQTGPKGAFATPDQLLGLVVEHNASDIHMSVASPPCIRINGQLVKMETRALFPEDMEKLASEIATPEQMQRVRSDGSVDFAFTFRERNRF